MRNSVPPNNAQIPTLRCLALGVFHSSVPAYLRCFDAVDYAGLFIEVLKPFFLARQRCVGLGDYFSCGNVKVKVMGCDPAYGFISSSTLIQCYETFRERAVVKVQFAAIAPNELTDQLFSSVIRPYFRNQPRHIHKDQYFSFQGVECLVVALEPSDGLVTSTTDIHLERGPLEQLSRVKLSPIGETLPRDVAATRGISLTQLLQGHYILPYLKGWRRVLTLNAVVKICDISFRVMDSDLSHGYVGEHTNVVYDGEVINQNSEARRRGEPYEEDIPVLRLTLLPNGQLVVIDDRREAFLRQMMQMEGLLHLLDHSGMQGAETDAINSLPTRRIEKLTEDEEKTRCTVCLTDFIVGDEVRTLPCCKNQTGHFFHKTCIDDWLPRSKCCPLCKHPIDQEMPGEDEQS